MACCKAFDIGLADRPQTPTELGPIAGLEPVENFNKMEELLSCEVVLVEELQRIQGRGKFTATKA